MHNVYLFYPQYQEGSGEYSSHWLPYTITTLWAYVEQFEDIRKNYQVKDIFFSRDQIQDVVNSLDDPNVCLFSTYTWNHNYNRLLAEAIKEKYPNCCIVFGGPQIPEESLKPEEPYVDSYVVKEGENSLLELLRDYFTGSVKPVYRVTKRTNIATSPSPYVDSNLMNLVIKKNPEKKWAMVMETNRGCPFGCTFCDWGSLTKNKIKQYDLNKVFREIDWLCANKIEYLYIADANYGALYERDLAITNYIAKKKRETGYPYVVNVNWYKNATKRIIKLNKIFDSVGLSRGMTLSVQSMNETVLKNVQRDNMGINNLKEMYEECNKNNVRFYTEFIMGLPGETLSSFKHGLCKVIDLGCHTTIDVYPFEIMPNAPAYKQITEFELDVKKYPAVIPNQPTSIPEYFNVVKGTKHMPSGDIVQAWIWFWILQNLHYYNWTQMLCRFAYRHLGINAKEFYTEIWNDLVICNDIIRNEYIQKRREIEDVIFLNTDADPDILSITHYSDQHIWHQHRDEIYNDIERWAERFFIIRYGVSEKLTKNIILFNKMYNVNSNVYNSETLNFDYNLYDYIIKNVPLKNLRTHYKFSNRVLWKNLEEFNMLIYRRHTFGFSQRKVTNITA